MTTPSTPRIFDPTFRDLVRDATPIEDLVNADLRAAGHPPLSGHGDEREGWHSVHGSQSGASLKVNVAKQVYTCFNCGEGGDVFSWLMQAQRCSFVEALHTLAQRAGIPLPHLDAAQQQQWQQAQQERHDLEGLFRAAATFFHAQLTQEHRDFCVQQWGLTAETIERYQLGFAPDDPAALQRTLTGQHFTRDLVRKSGLVIQVGSSWHDLFQGRLIFPYWRDLPDPQTQQPGTPLYFIGRRIDGVTPDRAWEAAKYRKQLVHSPKHPYVSPAVTNTYFYGEHVLRGMKDVPLLVTEGVADCLAGLQAGVPTISPVTVHFSKASHPRLLQMAHKVPRILICNDNEASGAGVKGALETAAFLDEKGVDVRLITLPRPAGTAKIDLADYLKTHAADAFYRLCAQGLEYVEALMRTYPVGADPYENCLMARQFFVDVLAPRPRRQDATAFLRHRASTYFGLSSEDLADLLGVYQQTQAPVSSAPPQGGTPSIWDRAISAYAFANQPDTLQESLVDNLVVPQGITLLAAPRGVGKSMVAIALGVAASTGSTFLGKPITEIRVLLIDRDNPSRTMRRRLRDWGVVDTTNFKVLSRNDGAPNLLDRQAWQLFPAASYDLIIIDSLGAASEGVSETEGRLTQQVMATLKDLAAQGPAILCLDNTIKSALNIRGRGEKADAVDIVYEIREVSGWTPTSECWWEDLPEAGEHTWAQRASRRRKNPVHRLAFIPSKFRPDVEPEPFIVELNLAAPPWTITEITTQIEQEAVQQERIIKGAQQDTLRQACDALEAHLRGLGENGYLNKRPAETFLKLQGLSWPQARNVLEAENTRRWELRAVEGKGNPIGVFPKPSTGSLTAFPNADPQNDPQETLPKPEPISQPSMESAFQNQGGFLSSNGTIEKVPGFGNIDNGRLAKSAGVSFSDDAAEKEAFIWEGQKPLATQIDHQTQKTPAADRQLVDSGTWFSPLRRMAAASRTTAFPIPI